MSLPTLLEGGLIEEDGRVAGAWFLDRHDLLGALSGSRTAHGTLWLGGRDAGRPRAGQSLVAPSVLVWPASLARVTEWRDMTRVPLHGLLDALERIAAMAHLLTDDPDGDASTADMVAELMGDVMPGVATVPLIRHVESEAVRLVGILGPFIEGVDLGASRRIGFACDQGLLGEASLDIVHAALDRSFDPDAPLASAWDWHPMLKGLSAGFMMASPDAFRAAVAAGPDAFRLAMREMIVAAGAPGAAHADRVLATERVIGPMDDEDERMVFEAVAASGHDPLLRVCGVLSELPASWWPQDRDAFLSYACCHPAARWCVARAVPGSAGRLLNAGGDWPATSARLRRAHGLDGSNATLTQVMRDLDDVSRAFAAQALQAALVLDGRPPAAMGAVERVAEEVLWSGRGVASILESSREWHARQEAILSALPLTSRAVSWPACLPDADYGDVTVTVITDRATLVREGAGGEDADGRPGLSHCVGGYAPQCLDGTSRILSLRSADGRRLSTAEVDLRFGQVGIIQHRGRSNSAPPDAASAALARYQGDVGEGRLATEGTMLPVTYRRTLLDEVCGYDVRVPEAWDLAWGLWAPFLPRATRSLTREGVVRLVDRLVGSNESRWWREGGVDLRDLASPCPATGGATGA